MRKKVERAQKLESTQRSNRKFFLPPAIVSALAGGSISFLMSDMNAYFVAPLALLISGAIYLYGSLAMGSAATKEFLKVIRLGNLVGPEEH